MGLLKFEYAPVDVSRDQGFGNRWEPAGFGGEATGSGRSPRPRPGAEGAGKMAPQAKFLQNSVT